MAIEHAANRRSASLSHDGSTYVLGDETIRCRRDYMIVEPMVADLSRVLTVIERTKPLRGIVKAVGPGHYPKRYDHPDKHTRTKMWDSKTFQPTECKVGDIVELGGIEFGGYSWQSFLWGQKLHIWCREADVSGIVTPPCIGADSSCPCQDGLACHYRDAADGTKAWPIPEAA